MKRLRWQARIPSEDGRLERRQRLPFLATSCCSKKDRHSLLLLAAARKTVSAFVSWKLNTFQSSVLRIERSAQGEDMPPFLTNSRPSLLYVLSPPFFTGPLVCTQSSNVFCGFQFQPRVFCQSRKWFVTSVHLSTGSSIPLQKGRTTQLQEVIQFFSKQIFGWQQRRGNARSAQTFSRVDWQLLFWGSVECRINMASGSNYVFVGLEHAGSVSGVVVLISIPLKRFVLLKRPFPLASD